MRGSLLGKVKRKFLCLRERQKRQPFRWWQQYEIKRPLFLGRKAMTNLDSIVKTRDITLPTKLHLVQAMVFPVVMYGYESWTVKKAECRRIDVFELWCWRRLLRVPWTTGRSNLSILKEISPEYSLEGLMLKLKLQLFECMYFMNMKYTVTMYKEPDEVQGTGMKKRRFKTLSL